ncbi:MAG TPA: hypothetical protein VFH53_02995 [Phycisphaerae bacterium]|nr:hypothetical protein [Phycisphaerae bacterium]
MKTRYKVLIALVAVVGLFVAAGVVAGVLALVILSQDEPPPDDSDLRVERAEVPDEQNAFTYFDEAWQLLHAAGDEQLEEVQKALDGGAWDPNLGQQFLDAGGGILERLERGLVCSRLQAPEIRSMAEDYPYIGHWAKLGQWSLVRMGVLRKFGRSDALFDEAARTVRFGHLIEAAGLPLHVSVVGTSVKSGALHAVRETLAESSLSPDRLADCAKAIDRCIAEKHAICDSWRAEYGLFIRTLEDVTSGRADPAITGHEPGTALAPGMNWHPNRTRHMFAEVFRTFIGNVGRAYSEKREVASPLQPGRWAKWKTVLGGNAMGKAFVGLSLSPCRAVEDLRYRVRVELAATRALLAMKAFKVEKGRLPETLDKLVPEYLEAVPLDDFDGKPLRYNAEKKVIYSVGKDLKDAGGMTEEEQKAWWTQENPSWDYQEYGEPDVWQLPDPSFAIEF